MTDIRWKCTVRVFLMMILRISILLLILNSMVVCESADDADTDGRRSGVDDGVGIDTNRDDDPELKFLSGDSISDFETFLAMIDEKPSKGIFETLYDSLIAPLVSFWDNISDTKDDPSLDINSIDSDNSLMGELDLLDAIDSKTLTKVKEKVIPPRLMNEWSSPSSAESDPYDNSMDLFENEYQEREFLNNGPQLLSFS